MFNIEELLKVALTDPGLNQTQKQFLQNSETKKEIMKFLSGAAGMTVAVSIAKYAKLGKTAQLILGMAGFGAGRLLYDVITKEQKQEQVGRQFSSYDDKLKSYIINRND